MGISSKLLALLSGLGNASSLLGGGKLSNKDLLDETEEKLLTSQENKEQA